MDSHWKSGPACTTPKPTNGEGAQLRGPGRADVIFSMYNTLWKLQCSREGAPYQRFGGREAWDHAEN